MAYQHTQASHDATLLHSALAGVKSAFGFVAQFLISISAANRRVHLAEKLQAKSDQELAALGLRREDIARYVFRDMLDV